MSKQWTIGGDDPEDRLMSAIRRERWLHDVEPPTRLQVAMVLHALADHTAIMQALDFSRGDAHWPEATSVGRWLHAYGDYLDGSHGRFGRPHQDRETES